MTLTFVAAAAAAVAGLTGLTEAVGSESATQVLEVWRGMGLLVFAGSFCLLARWPRRLPGLWELVICNKLALALAGLVLMTGEASDAETLAVWDGMLCVLLLAAYVLRRGWRAWRGRPLHDA